MTQTLTTKNFSSAFQDFRETLRAGSPVKIDSMYVVGSALTVDFSPERSDINSIIIPEAISQPLLDFLVQLGSQYCHKKVAAPLVMTLQYIQSSLDTFPIEFLNFQKIHYTLFGQDRFNGLLIDREKLRLECERELRSRQLWLGQAYIESLGDNKLLLERVMAMNNGMMSLFRSILFLAGKEVSFTCHDVCQGVENVTGQGMEIFASLWKIKNTDLSAEKGNVQDYFRRYYAATQQLVTFIDAFDS